jgi:hypothetical protein
LSRFIQYYLMDTLRKVNAGTEQRRDHRYALPVLEVVIGDEHFRAINWSMRGALLYGICEVVGARVRGEMGVPGSSEALPFAATVVRADLDTGNSAICFEDGRTEGIEFHQHACAASLQ